MHTRQVGRIARWLMKLTVTKVLIYAAVLVLSIELVSFCWAWAKQDVFDEEATLRDIENDKTLDKYRIECPVCEGMYHVYQMTGHSKACWPVEEWKVEELRHEQEVEVVEPNEPEYTYVCTRCKGITESAELLAVHNCRSITTGKRELPDQLTRLIPTWPQYIELEKDLVCFPPDDNDVCTVGDGIEWLLLTKGTKIYFKEQDE